MRKDSWEERLIRAAEYLHFDNGYCWKSGMEIILVEPAALTVGAMVELEVHTRGAATGNGDVHLVARQGDQGLADIPCTEGTTRLVIQPTTTGLLDLELRVGPDSFPVSGASILVGPQDMTQQVLTLFEDSVGVISDPEMQNNLESPGDYVAAAAHDGTLARRVVWINYFRHLMRDISQIVRGVPDNGGQQGSSLEHILVYLVENRALAVANFVLQSCMDRGVQVTFQGQNLTREDIESGSIWGGLDG